MTSSSVRRVLHVASPRGGGESRRSAHAAGAIASRSGLIAASRRRPAGGHRHPRACAACRNAQHLVRSYVETRASNRTASHASGASDAYASHVTRSNRPRAPSTNAKRRSSSTRRTISVSISSGRARNRHAVSLPILPATGRISGTPSTVNASGSAKRSSSTAGHVPVSANPQPSGANPTSCRKNVERSPPSARSSHRHEDALSFAAAEQHGTKSVTSGAGPGAVRVRRWHIATAVSIWSSQGRVSSSAPPSEMSSSTVATSVTLPTSSMASSVMNDSNARASVHTSPVLTWNPHAIGVNACKSRKNVAFLALSSPTTAPSQKHAAASISETTKQHAGKAAGLGRCFLCVCIPTSHVIAAAGTWRRHICLRYAGSDVATRAMTRTNRSARVTHPSES